MIVLQSAVNKAKFEVLHSALMMVINTQLSIVLVVPKILAFPVTS